MIDNPLEEEYFNWLYDLVCTDEYTQRTHYKLFSFLYDEEFLLSMYMDSNRAADGIELRYEFAKEKGIDPQIIVAEIDTRECSILEMMLALARRCENQIMANPDVGDRVGQWFWEMIVTLGLGKMDDDNFDYDTAKKIIRKFLRRTYRKNGEGGLFRINDRSKDMRTTEIWYQMNWYLNELLFDE